MHAKHRSWDFQMQDTKDLNKSRSGRVLNPDANELMQIDEDTLVAYVDGSYDHSQKRFSYGMVLMHDGKERYFCISIHR